MIKFQLKRFYFQIVAFFAANLGALGLKTGFCYPFFYCHACPSADAACPLRLIEKGVYKNSIKWQFLLFPFLVLGVFGSTSGRAVCAWACPIGLLQRITGKFARKVKKIPFFKNLSNPEIDRYLRYTKYFLLIGLVAVTTYLIGFMFTDICPVGVLTGSIPILILNPGKFIPTGYFLIAIVIFVLFLILIFLIERGWCRYFCPVGAILAPFNKISFLHVEVDDKKCVNCNLCSDVCPMGIDIPNMHRDPECILCGKCVTSCPHSAVSFHKPEVNFSK